jgi:hypothetical protein
MIEYVSVTESPNRFVYEFWTSSGDKLGEISHLLLARAPNPTLAIFTQIESWGRRFGCTFMLDGNLLGAMLNGNPLGAGWARRRAPSSPDEAPGILISELLDQSTLDYIRKRDARK